MLYRLMIALLVLAAVFAACGTGDDDDDDNGANGEKTPAANSDGLPTSAPPPDATNPAQQATPGPPPLVGNADDVPLTPFVSDVRGYELSYPTSWIVDDSGPSFDTFSYYRDTRGLAAYIQVQCRTAIPGSGEAVTPEALQRADLAALQATAPYQADEPTTTELDGKNAIRWHYTVSVQLAPRANQWVYYIEDEGCAWRLAMIVYGNPPVDPAWEQLADRIAGTFRSRSGS